MARPASPPVYHVPSTPGGWWWGFGDVDHVNGLTAPDAALLMRACRADSKTAAPLAFPGRDYRYAKPDWHCSNRAVELDSPNRLGLDLGWPLLDNRVGVLSLPLRAHRQLVLGGVLQVPLFVLPDDSAGGGCVGHDGVALYDPVPFGTRPLPRGAAHVVVGRGAHGVVLLVRPRTLPSDLHRLGLGSAPARHQFDLANAQEPDHVAIRLARFDLAPARGPMDRLCAARVLVGDRGHDLHVHAAPDHGRTPRRPDRVRGEPAGAGGAAVVLLVHHHRRQLRVHPGAERSHQDPRGGADRVDGPGGNHGRPVRGAIPVP